MINTILALINAFMCGVISLVLIGMVLSPKIHDGVVIKVGLSSMAFGFGAIALQILDGLRPSSVQGMGNGLLLINAGLTVVIIGYLWRKAKAHHPVRRTTDWADLDTRP